MGYFETPPEEARKTPGAEPGFVGFKRENNHLLLQAMIEGKHTKITMWLPVVLQSIQSLFPDYQLKWVEGGAEVEQQPSVPLSRRESLLIDDDPGGTTPTLSVAMIVKDEEKCLAQCLDSIKDVADEIVIVDTGSTDRTVAIAKGYTDRVFFHPWEDDFSKARNHSLSYCTCAWILQIDADEELVQADIPKLTALLRRLGPRPGVSSAMISILSVLQGGAISRSFFPRLFRRGMCRFEGIVHNQLIQDGKSESAADVRIMHHGYNLPDTEYAKKGERSRKLLEKQLLEDPEHPFTWANLIHYHRNRRHWPFVIENAHHVLENERALFGQRQLTALDLVVAHHTVKDWELGIGVALKALEECPENPDMIFWLALLYKEDGEIQKAIAKMTHFLAVRAAERLEGANVSGLFCDTFSMAPYARARIDEWEKELEAVPV